MLKARVATARQNANDNKSEPHQRRGWQLPAGIPLPTRGVPVTYTPKVRIAAAHQNAINNNTDYVG